MTKAPKRKLKVFLARFGFHDSVVAAPSQAAALRAWGTHQNLFADNQAGLATEPDAVKAALAQPETPLRRLTGSRDPFQLEPTGLPAIPAPPKKPPKPATRVAAEAEPPHPVAKPPPDRRALDRAEAAIRKLDDARKREEADFRQRQGALDQQRSKAQQAYVDARRSASVAVVAARTAYRKAGGKD